MTKLNIKSFNIVKFTYRGGGASRVSGLSQVSNPANGRLTGVNICYMMSVDSTGL